MTGCAVDFLPPEWRERRSRRRLWAYRAGLTALLALVLGAGSWAVGRRLDTLERTLVEVRQRRDAVQSRIAQVERLDRKKTELERRLNVLADVLARTRGGVLLAAVGAAVPQEVRLRRLDVRAKLRADPPVVDVSIEGRCPDDLAVADFLSRLSRHPLFEEARMVLSEDVDSHSNEKKFVIAAHAPPYLDEERLERVLEVLQ